MRAARVASSGGMRSESAEAIAEILEEHLDLWQSALAPVSLSDLRESTERDAGSARSFFGRHAAADVLLDQHSEVILQFAIELVVQPFVCQCAAYPRRQHM